VAETVKLEFWK